MRAKLCVGVATTLALGMVYASAPASAEVVINLEEVASGLTAPMAMVSPPGDDRRFIAEQVGLIKILMPDGTVLDEPFLDIRHKIVTQWALFDERGLLGLAFHPDYANNGKFYIAYSGVLKWDADLATLFWWDHTNYIEEYQVSADDADVADPNSARSVSAINWPQFNHNGHWIGFGPDDMLYVSTGDGGYANDWGIGHNPATGNGQDTIDLHGKILRIDVNADSGYGVPADNPFVGNDDYSPEIYALGMRNAWRCSFDMGGDNGLFCGDVQQNSYEEVSIIEAGGNYGWRRMEAGHCFDYLAPDDHPADCDMEGLSPPIIEYNNCTAKGPDCEGISVTGGYVYRGGNADWDGKYIFGDWSKSFGEMDGVIFIASEGTDGSWTKETATIANMDGPVPYVLAFAQDNAGDVYALTSRTTGPSAKTDSIYKIVPAN